MSVTPARDENLDLGEAVMLTGIVVSSGTQQDVRQAVLDSDVVIAKMAATSVRRMCNQHNCAPSSGTSCAHPEHRRDVDFMAHVLDVLGLPGTHQEVTEGDREQLLVALAHQPDEPMRVINDQE